MIRANEWPRNNNRKVPDWCLHARLANVKSGLMQALTISSAVALEKQFAEIAESQPELFGPPLHRGWSNRESTSDVLMR